MGGLSHQKKCVYLAGAIERAPDSGATWRRYVQGILTDLGFTVFNPCFEEFDVLDAEEKKYFRHWKTEDPEKFQKAIRKILERDLHHLMHHTQLVVCYYDRYAMEGAGTAGELTLAYWARIPVYLVLGIPRAEVPSWILGCATRVFEDFRALEEALREQCQSRYVPIEVAGETDCL
jgi:hypothetical protein